MSTDAELIYNALLRAERRLEGRVSEAKAQPPYGSPYALLGAQAALLAVAYAREEIGNGIARERP